MQDPLVSVVCMTCNYKNYIKNDLDSLAMQKNNFLFEVLVHDVALTDGTTKMVRKYETEYPNLIIQIYQKKNQYSKNKTKFS